MQSLAGVIGGEASGCTETTTAAFIECALFDPVAVALTGRRHAIASDARQRFERGIDQALLPAALEAATALILQVCGGTPSHVTAAGAEPAWRRTAPMRFDRLRTFGGATVLPDDAVASLERLGFTTTARDDAAATFAVPSWRNDIAAPVTLDPSPTLGADRTAALAEAVARAEPEADLVEEVLRLRGLDIIPPVSLPPTSAIPQATLTPRQVRAAIARRTLAAAGLLECVTFSFMDHATASRFAGAKAPPLLTNPIAADLDQLRPTPVATLAEAAARNQARGLSPALLFELGPAFAATAQETVAAGLLAGQTRRHPGAPARPYDAMDAKSHALAVLAALGLPTDSLSTTTDAPAWYHPGQSGQVRQGPRLVLATFGALHPGITATLGLPCAAAFELFLDRVPEPKRRRRAPPDLPQFQPLRRDFAFLVPTATLADTLLRAARGADRTLITEARIFDIFQGGTVPEGQKSIAIEVTLQPRDHTLTDAEIEAVTARIVAAVTKTGAVLR